VVTVVLVGGKVVRGGVVAVVLVGAAVVVVLAVVAVALMVVVVVLAVVVVALAVVVVALAVVVVVRVVVVVALAVVVVVLVVVVLGVVVDEVDVDDDLGLEVDVEVGPEVGAVVAGGTPGRLAVALAGWPRYIHETVTVGVWQRTGHDKVTGKLAVARMAEAWLQPGPSEAVTCQLVPAGWPGALKLM
jgi:hypothetical protein